MSTRSVSGQNKIDLKHRLRVHHYEISQNCASMMTRGCQEAFTRVVKAKKTKKANKAIFLFARSVKIVQLCSLVINAGEERLAWTLSLYYSQFPAPAGLTTPNFLLGRKHNFFQIEVF